MDTFYWLTAALIFSVSSICGTLLVREKMRNRALESYNIRNEKEYQQIARERDAWRMAYEQEHGIKVAQQATIEVQQILLRNKKVKDCGGHVGGKIGGRK